MQPSATWVHTSPAAASIPERPDQAAIREAIEETGVTGGLTVLGVVGVQQSLYNNGNPCISVFFHLRAEEPRDAWSHTMIGDPEAWDTGHDVHCRFRPLDEATQLLHDSGYGQDEFVPLLFSNDRDHRSTLARSHS
ncbi:NUDIX domain-containing protein [Catellatospora tritici]|uniref:NUDIX domain-containing protein n=1 Tax=Catellatospora tritici TaxID=2851566 RepID=UPI001C2DE2C3|nr:NUDIX hydrolase [Catellatospora tritici]